MRKSTQGFLTRYSFSFKKKTTKKLATLRGIIASYQDQSDVSVKKSTQSGFLLLILETLPSVLRNSVFHLHSCMGLKC